MEKGVGFMIILSDERKVLKYPLTDWIPIKESLDFATKHFKNSKKRDCIVKTCIRELGEEFHAVFIDMSILEDELSRERKNGEGKS